MFLIGAPLGAIIKKGGFGIPVVVAVSFFILMYILTQQGDKMAKEGKVIVQIGAWISNGILALIGSYFMKIALQDSRLFESDFYKILFDKIKNRMFKQHTINE
jgi:lipopolysaccharide export system permease protein